MIFNKSLKNSERETDEDEKKIKINNESNVLTTPRQHYLSSPNVILLEDNFSSPQLNNKTKEDKEINEIYEKIDRENIKPKESI
ncbi:MAG: hypothetical protein KBF86_14185, partial [Chitinophagales bacterium]|nr:hypothetical protein [Chitinophagales bacterium]